MKKFRRVKLLIEEHSGKFPLWLAPTQVTVASITSDADPYVIKVVNLLKEKGIRVASDIRNEKINYKIREHSLAKVPVILSIGEREVNEGTVNVRRLGTKETQSMLLDEAIERLHSEALPPDSV